MKKKILIFSVLFLFLFAASITAAKQSPEPQFECYIWYVDANCYVNDGGGWNIDDHGGAYANPDGDYMNNYEECLWALDPNDDDTDNDGFKDSMYLGDIVMLSKINGNFKKPAKKITGFVSFQDSSSANYDTSQGNAKNPDVYFYTNIQPTSQEALADFVEYDLTEGQESAALRCLNQESTILEVADGAQLAAILNSDEDQSRSLFALAWMNICMNRISRNCGTKTALGDATVIELINYCEDIYMTSNGNEATMIPCNNVIKGLVEDSVGFEDVNVGEQCYVCPTKTVVDNPSISITGSIIEAEPAENLSLWQRFINWLFSLL